jgi:hypothetical protein
MLPWPITSAARRLPSASSCPEAFARPNQFDRLEQRRAAAERQPRFIEQPTLDALHRERNRPAGADRIDAQLVAALRRPQHRRMIAHAAQ